MSDEDRAPSAAVLAEPRVAAWLAEVAAINRAQSCVEVNSMAPQLSDDVARLLITVPDDVLQELALNLDAASGAAAALCERHDESAALREWTDAVALADLLTQRAEEIR